MTPMQRYIADLNHEMVVFPSDEPDDVERRVAVVYGQDEVDWQMFGRQIWTPLERLQAVDAVKLRHGGATLWATDLPEGHPMRGRYMMSMGKLESITDERGVVTGVGLKVGVPSYHHSIERERDSWYEKQYEMTQAMRDAVTRGIGITKMWFDECEPDPLAAMTRHKDTHTLAANPVPPAKPVLLVPDGCVLVLPNDIDHTAFLKGYDVQCGKTGGIVSKSAYELLQRVGAEQQVEQAAERAQVRTTHAALTFEQPIQSRLGRMAK